MLNKPVPVLSSLLTKINTDVHLCTSFRKRQDKVYQGKKEGVLLDD